MFSFIKEVFIYFNIFMILAGFCILFAGIYFFVKEKNDENGRKVYGSMCLIGIVIIVANFFKFNL